MTIIISFHFCPDYNNESNEMVELVYFHKSIQNRALWATKSYSTGEKKSSDVFVNGGLGETQKNSKSSKYWVAPNRTFIKG